ncbi:GTPase ObgE [Tuwongella immobilis]|uniref:GTPase Obg n=1 Tax=Tuwongella immobilis TaxID=692036 RepID=A0A6C2YQK6_9BACT|nr:GTPase ObgE [Tuwongella immobilis]VIP03637.1 gtpase : GTPase Obg OS=Singulisphaera acidiphila (strain ATCC BAA-1392 / DSM 18658 / VKM B-2454 / MOB10) GN=obg PE=3 SV=1: GTP1_OBG: MMR_HSR1 [Tuwongella immobilis]VTS04642.1 gtpase : GTPase Obg OS=Singulisphaera acidiphila (strain ATCC BAA-1392 / DSM 18658 / VKM B-2454 / MOB10) GN=obg PE=3 SV=1: GTP1_OBG: MMR_HSR1 [Tuwongella immobilis]
MFVDRAEIFVRGGDGGRGASSFRREKYVPKGGPDGGDGGRGGSVIIIAQVNADSLAPLIGRKFWKAEHGQPGTGANCHGRDGKDLIIYVPPGTIIRDRDRGNIIKDLTEHGQSVVVGQGGRGGRGNKHFATSTNRAPRETGPAGEGEARWLALELKVIADAGLIGKPNAGKSTMLSRLSRATPEIADYPFTTKYPNLGIVSLGGDHRLVLADLPGLIEGAADGVGLGHEFLRHVERTRVLVHLIEPFPTDGTTPKTNYEVIRRELELYSPILARKPEVVAISKAELTGSDEIRQQFQEELGREVLLVSAVTGAGLALLVKAISEALANAPKEPEMTHTLPTETVAIWSDSTNESMTDDSLDDSESLDETEARLEDDSEALDETESLLVDDSDFDDSEDLDDEPIILPMKPPVDSESPHG